MKSNDTLSFRWTGMSKNGLICLYPAGSMDRYRHWMARDSSLALRMTAESVARKYLTLSDLCKSSVAKSHT